MRSNSHLHMGQEESPATNAMAKSDCEDMCLSVNQVCYLVMGCGSVVLH